MLQLNIEVFLTITKCGKQMTMFLYQFSRSCNRTVAKIKKQWGKFSRFLSFDFWNHRFPFQSPQLGHHQGSTILKQDVNSSASASFPWGSVLAGFCFIVPADGSIQGSTRSSANGWSCKLLHQITDFLMISTLDFSIIICQLLFVSLRLRVQNAVPAQPCVGKLGISLVLLNFLHCNFRLWFKTP